MSDDVDIKEVPLSLIKESDRLRLRHRPYAGVDQLAADIRARGQTTPLFVIPELGGSYALISGYRRRAALELLKAPTALVRIFRRLDPDQAYDLAISENQDRDALTDIERADVCARLQKEGRTVEQIGKRMGWSSESNVFRFLRVARESPPHLREALQHRRITISLAVAFLDYALELPEETQHLALSVAAESELSTAEFTRYLKKAAGVESNGKSEAKDPLRVLKDGGFILTAKADANDRAGVERTIDVLQTALRKARHLKRKLDAIAEVGDG